MRAITLLISLVLLETGCDSVNVQQYRIAAASGGDRAQAKRGLRSVAKQLSLEDRTSISRAPKTLVFYIEPNVEHFAVQLGARGSDGDVLIDLNAGFGPRPRKDVEAERLLASEIDVRSSSDNC